MCDGGDPTLCTPICGDGLVRGEPCDDGDLDPGDGCSPDCELEAGWSCDQEPSICSAPPICPPQTQVESGALLESCKAYRDAGYEASGAYFIDPDGSGPRESVAVVCDMITDGGGWTIIANNDNADAEPSGCQPRFATAAGLECGEPACDADFAARADGILFSQLAWAAYSGDFVVAAANVLVFDTPVALPNAAQWALSSDQQNTTLPEWAALPLITCNDVSPSRIERVRNKQAGTGGAYPAGEIVSIFDGNSDDNGKGNMSFTDDHTGGNGSLNGLDDFQDGAGCGDSWAPKANRGASTFVMIR